MNEFEFEYQRYQTLVDSISSRESLIQVFMIGLGEVYDEHILDKSVRTRIRKRMYSVFIELAQNIHHYSAARAHLGKNVGTGIVVVSENDHHYTITSGNIASRAAAEQVAARIGELNGLDAEGLKRVRRITLRLPIRKEAKGPGLGFIDIRRKTDHPLTCTTDAIDDQQAFLVLSALIDKEE